MMPPVIILAGGLGMRLRSITQNKMPKPMVPVTYKAQNYPFMEYLLSYLQAQGIDEVIMCIDHLGEQVISHFGDGRQYGIQISYDKAGPVQTAARVRHALEKITHPEVIIHCGDVFHPLDIGAFIDHFHQNPHNLMQIAVHRPQPGEPALPNLALENNGQVVRYKPDLASENRLVLDTGVLIARREVLSYIPDLPSATLNDDLYPALIAHKAIGTHETTTAFYDIGTPGEYSRFCQYVANEAIRPISLTPT